jgi:hypothetical protein
MAREDSDCADGGGKDRFRHKYGDEGKEEEVTMFRDFSLPNVRDVKNQRQKYHESCTTAIYDGAAMVTTREYVANTSGWWRQG